MAPVRPGDDVRQRDGFRTLAESAQVTYDVESSEKGPKAANVQTSYQRPARATHTPGP